MKHIFVISILIFFSCNTGKNVLSKNEISKNINLLINDWHKAASNADLENYFNKMSKDAIYLGTDASERWTKQEFYKFCKPYFDKGKAWNFKPLNRHIYFSEDMNTVWFEETLDTWMGDCRGSGVLVYKSSQWKIKHYNLSVAVPNELVQDYIKLLNQ